MTKFNFLPARFIALAGAGARRGGSYWHLLGLVLLAMAAVTIHGYHLGSDDAAIYVPAIKQVADPALYPFGSEFFLSHARLSLFSNLVGESARLPWLSADLVIFLWHLAGVFLLLLATWRLMGLCFSSEAARWGGVALMASVLSVPVAGVALVVMDPYLTARTLSTPTTLFAIAAFAGGKPRMGALWLILTAAIHPQMAVYGIVFVVCLLLASAGRGSFFAGARAMAAAPPILPLLFDFKPSSGAARDALLSRTYFLVSNWAWYEWAGVIAPLALCWWVSRRRPAAALRSTTPAFQSLLRAIVPFGLLFTAAGLLLAASPRFENLTRFQPMRAFHLVYVLFFALLGGLAGEFVLRGKVWRWCLLFIPLGASMWILQSTVYSSSPHIEWPGETETNPWMAGFAWIRYNTPKDALFALDPGYMLRDGEDQHGFRALAERSTLADSVKDSGAVSLFPQLAEHWKDQVAAQQGLERFTRADFRKLARLYPVTWFVTGPAAPAGFACPYRNSALSVCRLDYTGSK